MPDPDLVVDGSALLRLWTWGRGLLLRGVHCWSRSRLIELCIELVFVLNLGGGLLLFLLLWGGRFLGCAGWLLLLDRFRGLVGVATGLLLDRYPVSLHKQRNGKERKIKIKIKRWLFFFFFFLVGLFFGGVTSFRCLLVRSMFVQC